MQEINPSCSDDFCFQNNLIVVRSGKSSLSVCNDSVYEDDPIMIETF